MKPMKEELLRKPVDLILTLNYNEGYIYNLSRKTNISYAHLSHIVDELEWVHLLTRRKEGRKVFIKLTEKGKKIYKHFKDIEDILKKGN